MRKQTYECLPGYNSLILLESKVQRFLQLTNLVYEAERINQLMSPFCFETIDAVKMRWKRVHFFQLEDVKTKSVNYKHPFHVTSEVGRDK